LDSRLSIVHVLDKNRFDTGSVHQMFQAAAGLQARGHDVTIVSRDDSTMAERAREHSMTFVPAPFSSDVDLRTISILRRVMRDRGADVVHVHKGRPHTLALAAAWRRPVRAFIVNRGVSFPLSIWNRAKYRTGGVDRVVTVCEAIRQVVIRTGKLPPQKVEVIYAGTDTSLFDPRRWPREDFRGEMGVAPGVPLIVQVGVRDWKGWRELVASFASVCREQPLARLLFVGCRTSGEIERVRAFASASGLGGLVDAIGVRHDMPRVLAAADCVVDASWAGTGVTGTIREAMAMERPVVATDVGGNGELVFAPDVGWLVPPRDTPALASALLEALEQSGRNGLVAAAARARVLEGFSMEVRLDRLESLYRKVIEEKRKE
jgi:glycosyltransferase involved in cell wall biosynthesis